MELHDWQAEKLMQVAKMIVVLHWGIAAKSNKDLLSDQITDLAQCMRVRVDNNQSVALPFHWQLAEQVDVREIVLTTEA